MKIVFFGTPDFVVPVLEALTKQFDVVGIVTTPDTLEGRKKTLTPSPVKAFGLAHQIPVLIPALEIRNLKLEIPQCDLFVVAAYGKIIPQSILDIPTFGSINIHPSLLPKYRGPSPLQSVLLKGEKKTGVSIILMDSQVDHGPLLTQWEYVLHPSDTFASLHELLFQQAAEKLPNTIERFVRKELTPLPQNHAEATFCQKIEKEDGYIDAENPPDRETLDKMIRAFYPWPTVYTKLRMKNEELKIVKFLPGKRIQVEGKSVVSMKEFLNGYPQMKEIIGKLGLGDNNNSEF